MPRFLQFHSLTSYPSALLNRDDAGFAKRIPFGGATRTRISSQCLKRHWRTFDGEGSLNDLGVPETIRSRYTFERFIIAPLLEEHVDPKVARAVTEALVAEILGQSTKAKKKREGAEEEMLLQTSQITVLGRPEVEYILKLAREACGRVTTAKQAATVVNELLGKDGKKNLEQLRHASGLGAALFGRMVTSDILARGDAAIHVAHAFTVHSEASESDYFSAVDDLLQEGDDEQLGSGHIGSTELTSGLYYGYVVVDVPLLISNLEGCKQQDWRDADSSLAAEVVARLAPLIATVSPGAKKGSTAPYSYAHLMLVEAGDAQPRTLANAFLKPVLEVSDVVDNSYAALARHVGEMDRAYGARTTRRACGLGLVAELSEAVGAGDPLSLDALAAWSADQLRQ